MGLLPANSILGQDNEMTHIPGDQAPAFLSSGAELIAICQLGVADLQGAHGINSLGPKPGSDLGGKVLVQVGFHADYTRPGDLR